MSLIYQSLKKLQSEDASGTGRDDFQPAGAAVRGTRLRHLLWLLPGALILAAGAYAAWSAGQSGQEPQEAESAAANGSRDDAVAKQPQSPERAETESAGTDLTAQVKKPPRLLHFTCRRNGTRARLGLEFDHRPAAPKTKWKESEQTLEVAFPRAVAGEEGSLSERAARKGTNLSLLSSEPLRLRLKAPELEGHSAFTLPGSAEYGPRCVLVLRFSPKSRENPPSDSDPPSRAARKESGKAPESDSRAEGEKDTGKKPEEPAEPEPRQNEGSGSLEVASSASAKSPPERTGEGASSAVRHASGEQDGAPAPRGPNSIHRRIRSAESLISQQRYRRVLQVLKTDHPPRLEAHPRYYALAAYASRKLDRHHSAARIYRKLAEAEPERGQWWMGLGLCLERMDRKGPALRAYERALKASGLAEEVRSFVRKRKQRLDRAQAKE